MTDQTPAEPQAPERIEMPRCVLDHAHEHDEGDCVYEGDPRLTPTEPQALSAEEVDLGAAIDAVTAALDDTAQAWDALRGEYSKMAYGHVLAATREDAGARLATVFEPMPYTVSEAGSPGTWHDGFAHGWNSLLDKVRAYEAATRESAGAGLTEAERFAANQLLDRPYADPDDDSNIVARAALRLAAARHPAAEDSK